MPTYQYSNIKTAANTRIHNKMGMISDVRGTINLAVKEAVASINFRSLRRIAPLAPNLFSNIYDYVCPSDLKNNDIVDIQPQAYNRSRFQDWSIVSESEFDQRKQSETGIITISTQSLIKKLRISITEAQDKTLVVDPLDSISGNGGTWVTLGGAQNLVVDTYNYIKGTGSLKFDIGSGSNATAGIKNTNLNASDITTYYNNGSVFIWHYITDITGITSYTLQLGSDQSNYYSMTVTQTNEYNSFQSGWNLLRFDFNGSTPTGTPVNTSITFCALIMNKALSKVSSLSYRFDHVQIKLGFIYNIIYYSKYPWQTPSGTWQQNSTADTDYINADEDEYNIIIEKVVQYCSRAVRESGDAADAGSNFTAMKQDYLKQWPDDSITLTDSYYDFASIDNDGFTYGVNNG